MIGEGQKIALIFEGRDVAGKDGTINRIMEYMSLRAVRTVALPKPSDRDRASWYFQRYVPHLPANGEMMILTGLGAIGQAWNLSWGFARQQSTQHSLIQRLSLRTCCAKAASRSSNIDWILRWKNRQNAWRHGGWTL